MTFGEYLRELEHVQTDKPNFVGKVYAFMLINEYFFKEI